MWQKKKEKNLLPKHSASLKLIIPYNLLVNDKHQKKEEEELIFFYYYLLQNNKKNKIIIFLFNPFID